MNLVEQPFCVSLRLALKSGPTFRPCVGEAYSWISLKNACVCFSCGRTSWNNLSDAQSTKNSLVGPCGTILCETLQKELLKQLGETRLDIVELSDCLLLLRGRSCTLDVRMKTKVPPPIFVWNHESETKPGQAKNFQKVQRYGKKDAPNGLDCHECAKLLQGTFWKSSGKANTYFHGDAVVWYCTIMSYYELNSHGRCLHFNGNMKLKRGHTRCDIDWRKGLNCKDESKTEHNCVDAQSFGSLCHVPLQFQIIPSWA